MCGSEVWDCVVVLLCGIVRWVGLCGLLLILDGCGVGDF